MLKIMQSGSQYDKKNARQQRNLYYAAYDNVLKIEIDGLAFYELNDLLSLKDLSVTKQKKLTNLKPGGAAELFRVGTGKYYYAVLLNEKEKETLEKFHPRI